MHACLSHASQQWKKDLYVAIIFQTLTLLGLRLSPAEPILRLRAGLVEVDLPSARIPVHLADLGTNHQGLGISGHDVLQAATSVRPRVENAGQYRG